MRNHEPFPSFSLSLSLSLLFSRSLSLSASLRHSPSLSLSHSLSVPLSLSLSVFPSTTVLSPLFHPFTCVHVHAYVFAPNVCARTCVRGARGVHRVAFFLPPPPPPFVSLYAFLSPPKQIVKTASAFVVIGRSFPKNQWPLVDHAVLSFLSTWPKRIT